MSITRRLSEALMDLARALDRRGNGYHGPHCLDDIEKRQLDAEEERRRRALVKGMHLPGMDAPAFSVIRDVPDLRIMPLADPMVPMYMLDRNYRILDWNEALSLAFDRTMEGRRGMSVLEWVFFLENFEEVLDHGKRTFSDVERLPVIDREQIKYKSMRYDFIEAEKRAYQIPGDDGTCVGWLAILDLKFADDRYAKEFQVDLINVLQKSLLWTDYATSYDFVLNRTEVYPNLLSHILGETGKPHSIPDDARILDLGAGTGNLTERLANSRRYARVFAIENNRAMLNLLKYKCKPYLRQDDHEPGVIAIKQDIGSLFGLPANYFDYVIMNNVLYSLSDPIPCLEQVHLVLKRGGEVRISGPQRRTQLSRLMRRIKVDLEDKGLFGKFRDHYFHVEEINRQLEMMPNFRRWDLKDMQELLLNRARFSELTYATDQAYAGDAMLVCARK
jgi:SAM-dependent methyltransferase/PAS domain-containing protein